MFLRVFRWNRLQTSRSSFRMATQGPGSGPIQYSPLALFTSSTTRAAVKVDQTKKSNNPSEENKEGHQDQATKAGSDKGNEHPAKQADPQPSPSKSTGVETEGPGSAKAGKGMDQGVHKDKEMEGGQHDNYPYAIKGRGHKN